MINEHSSETVIQNRNPVDIFILQFNSSRFGTFSTLFGPFGTVNHSFGWAFGSFVLVFVCLFHVSMTEFLGFLCMNLGWGGRGHVTWERTRLCTKAGFELMLPSCLSLQLVWIRVVCTTITILRAANFENSFAKCVSHLNKCISIHTSFIYVCINLFIYHSSGNWSQGSVYTGQVI